LDEISVAMAADRGSPRPVRSAVTALLYRS